MRRSFIPGALALLFLGSTVLADVPAPLPAAMPRPVTADDLEQVKEPGRPVFSQDGKQVAYALDDQIYVVPAAGGASRAVTSAGSSARNPRWSKDGRSLYFLSDRSGTSQLWKLPLDTFGEASQLTTSDIGIESLNFSTDESRLLLQSTEEAARKPDERNPRNPGSSPGSNSRRTPATAT
jgi:Tol biopolymer transport system component